MVDPPVNVSKEYSLMQVINNFFINWWVHYSTRHLISSPVMLYLFDYRRDRYTVSTVTMSVLMLYQTLNYT